ANPECLRLIDALCDRAGVGPLNELTEKGPVVFGLSLGRRLEAMSLPQRVKDELARQRQAAAAPAARRVMGGPADTHISPARPAVIQLLIESGDVESDDGEPSVAALGSL